MRQTALFSALMLIASTAQTAPQPNTQPPMKNRFDDQRIQNEQPVEAPIKNAQATSANQVSNEKTQTLSITKEELAKHPDLVIRALIPALAQNNGENVALIYPIYQTLATQYHTPLFDEWSQAIIQREQGDYSQSIQHYRNAIAQYPEHNMVRFQLAQTLLANNELEAAEDQFQKLRSEPKLDGESQQIINQYLQVIANQDRWDFGGGFTYLHDPNINNAPKSGTRIGNWQAPEAESAQGIGFNLDLGKKWSWGNGFYNELRLDLDGKYYWNNKKYNETSARGSLGIGFKNAKQNLALLPYLEQALYAGGNPENESLKRFSKSGGVALEWTYWLSPQWRTNLALEYGEDRYTTRKHLNGNHYALSSSLLYYRNAQQYWLIGLDAHRTSTRDKDDSYLRKGVRVGFGQEWKNGLSTYLGLNYAHKAYRAPMPIFNIKQRNHEYGITASLWHRAVQFKGITPRLVFSYSKVKSNHAFYTYDKARVFVEVSKRF